MIAAEKERLMREAIQEAKRGVEEGEAPIGCVIALSDKNGTANIVARGHNRSNALQRKNAHAEIIAFENAGSDGNGREPALPIDATGVILVSTLEPCVMCLGAAMESGVELYCMGWMLRQIMALSGSALPKVRNPPTLLSKVGF